MTGGKQNDTEHNLHRCKQAICPVRDGDVRTWRGSPADRLDAASKSGLFYLQIFLAAVSVITSILIICGVKNNVVKIIQIASLIASAVLFIVIMVIAQTTHPKY